MPEKFEFNPENNREDGSDIEKSNEIRDDFFMAMEATLDKEYNERNPKLPESERVLSDVTDDEGNLIAQVDRVRELTYEGEEDFRRLDLWYVIDFDDVINKTTEFNNAVRDFVMSETGMSVEEYQQIYDSSKNKNFKGKSVLRFEELKRQVEEKYSGMSDKIDGFMESVNYDEYVDQGVKRTLQALHNLEQKVKVSILTFGDTDYQKFRIDRTDLSDIVDEIIYTEGSKREAVEHLHEQQLREEEERQKKKSVTTATGPLRRFTILVDDSPDHLDDYSSIQMNESGVANTRFRHPQAKRYNLEVQAEDLVVAEESEENAAAVDLYMQARIIQEFGDRPQGDSQKDVFDLLKDRGNNRRILGEYGGLIADKNVEYRIDGAGNIIRASDRKWHYQSDTAYRQEEKDWGKINEDGILNMEKITPDERKSGTASYLPPMKEFNFVEYIKEAK